MLHEATRLPMASVYSNSIFDMQGSDLYHEQDEAHRVAVHSVDDLDQLHGLLPKLTMSHYSIARLR